MNKGGDHEVLPFVLQPMCAKDHRNKAKKVSNMLSKLRTQRYQAYLHMRGDDAAWNKQ